MRRGVILTQIALIGIFLLGSAIAAFNYDDDSLNLATQYSEGDIIRGRFNASISEEPSNTLLTSNFEGNKTLLEFLTLNDYVVDENYTCSIPGCEQGYASGSAVTQINLDSGDVIAGFSVSGTGVVVDEARFSFSSNAPSSCTPQIYIDFLDRGEAIMTNTEYEPELCGVANYGCFNEADSTTTSEIQSSQEYCNKVTMPAAPAFQVGARVTNTTGEASPLTMTLYDNEAFALGSCTLPEHTQDVEDLTCIIEHTSSVQAEYYVCIGVESTQSEYRLRREDQSPCGKVNPGDGPLTTDYELFIQNLKFSTVSLQINDSTFESATPELGGIEFSTYINDYVQEVYDGDCGSECIIPIKFSGDGSVAFLNNAFLEYSDLGGGGIQDTNIYSINTEQSTITTNTLVFDIQKAGFRIPVGASESDFEMFFGANKFIDEPINISESFDFDIEPTFIGFGQNTIFRIISGESVTKSTWNFGDGTSEAVVSADRITHQYLEQGGFEIQVTAETEDGTEATRTFDVVVGDPNSVANETIQDYIERIESLEVELSTYPVWVKQAVENRLNLSSLSAAITEIEIQYENANNDSEYQEVVLELIELNVPKSIRVGKTGSFPLLAGYENINLRFIEEISGETVGDDAKLLPAITSWIANNMEPVIGFEQYLITTDEGEEVLMSKFRIETKPKGSFESASLILSFGIDALTFARNYEQQAVLVAGTYMPLKKNAQGTNEIFEFLIMDDVNAEDLGAYITPVVSEVGDFEIEFDQCNFDSVCNVENGEDWRNCRADCPRWGGFWSGIGFLLVAALVVYIILQEWYKRHYEKSLFKNENDLYNLINFIYNARRSGLEDGKIERNLKKASWSGERIRFVMRKISGKRTGMFEIPIFKFLENKKVKKEITKRQGGKPVDARFIKRPRF